MRKLIVGFLVAAYIVFFSIICFLKYNSFEYHDFDLAVHSQTLWNITHGSIFNSILGIDFLGNHNHLILFLIAPIYKLFPSPLTILFVQTLSLGLAVIPLYLIAKKILSDKLATTISLMYLAYPALGYTNLFEFHPTVFAVPFLFFMFYFFLKNKFWKFLIFLILSLSCQENISLVIFTLGIFAIFNKKSPRWFLTPIVLGGLWFIASVYFLMPHFNKGEFKLITFYQQFGNSFTEVIKNIISHPLYVVKIMFGRQRIIFLYQIFAPVFFLPLFAPGYLFIILPLFMQHLLSLRASEQTIQFHYLAEMIPFIFISAVYGMKRFFSLKPVRNQETLFISILLILAVFYSVYLGPVAYASINLSFLKKDQLDIKKEEFIKRVPGSQGVIATFEFLPKLANRKLLFSFHNVTTGFYPYSNKNFLLPQAVKYAVIDFNDPLTMSSFYFKDSDRRIREFLAKGRFAAIQITDSIIFFEKGAESQVRPYEVLTIRPSISRKTNLNITSAVKFLGYDSQYSAGDSINFIFYWESLNRTDADINVYFDILNSKNEVINRFVRPICYRIYPTYSWKTGDIIKEIRSLIIPRLLPAGNYSLMMGFIDYRNGRVLFADSNKDILDRQGRLRLADFSVN